jgi:hypothetical protein
MHALTTFVATLPGAQKTAAMSIIVPTLLARADSEGEIVYKETSARLLDLAGNDQAAFRGVVGGMTEKQKGFMESVIVAGRQSQGVKIQENDGQGQEPTIALRMDFGV